MVKILNENSLHINARFTHSMGRNIRGLTYTHFFQECPIISSVTFKELKETDMSLIPSKYEGMEFLIKENKIQYVNRDTIKNID